jgi:pimeloyl-ACP methyl ester carboxylesterase
VGQQLQGNTTVKRLLVILLAVTVIALAYIALVEIPTQVRFAARTVLDTSPADVGLAYENFELRPADANIALKGWWIPAKQPIATLLFLHGGSSNRNSRYFEALEFYSAIVERGVSVAAIDLRNHGESGADDHGIQFGRTEQHDAAALVAWARQKPSPGPIFLMGISMGGATAIRAIHEGAQVDGLILLDSLLDTQDALQQAIWASSGLPPALTAPSAWAATTFYGFPGGEEQPLHLAAALDVPILVMQDPADPVTRAPYAESLAAQNSRAELWMAPAAQSNDARLAWKKRWGSHVAAFALYPTETIEQIINFMQRVIRE